MIVGLGVDIVEIDRMRTALARRPRLKQRLFSEDEQWYCEHKQQPEIHYALRFAAKEAVLKALGTGFRGMNFLDVEVARDQKGRPYPQLRGAAAEYARHSGIIEMHLSLSYTQTTAVASAVALTAQARPAPKTKPSTREELAREFKELRALLDDLQEVTGSSDAVADEGEGDGALPPPLYENIRTLDDGDSS